VGDTEGSLMLARFVLVASVVLVVWATFDLRYSGLLGPKRQTSDARSL
jgi:hypothetical protein